MRPLAWLVVAATVVPMTTVMAQQQQPQQQQQMPPRPVILTDADRVRLDAEAFSDAVESEFPLRDGQRIREALEIQQQQQQMLRSMRNVELRSASQMVSLSPGARSVLIPLAYGHASVISVIDITGKPWPIRTNTAGEGMMVSVSDPQSSANNMVVVAPRVQYARTNLALVLDGTDMPLMITLEAVDGVAIDSQVLQVDQPGPMARQPDALIAPKRADDDTMRALLDGAIPTGAALVSTTGADAAAYRVGTRLFLRTQSTLRWPAPIDVVYGVDDVRLYEVPPQAQMVLADRSGRIQRLTVADTGLLLDAALARRSPQAAPGSILQPLTPARNPYTHVIGEPVDDGGLRPIDPRAAIAPVRRNPMAGQVQVRPAANPLGGLSGVATQAVSVNAQNNTLAITGGLEGPSQ